MNIKKSSCILLFLLVFQCIFSQEIAIPYRSGNLWGICNENGKVLIEPKFDKLEFPNSYENAHDFMISKRNDLEGLIIDGKEILEPKYTSIYNDEDFFHVSSTENGSQRDILLPNGTSIFEKPFAKILYQTKIDKNQKLFHVLNQNLTESIFVYDMVTFKKIQVLYDNYHSISLVRTRNEITKVSEMFYLVKKTATSDLIAESWSDFKVPLIKKNTGFHYLQEVEFLQFFAGRYYSYTKEEKYSGSGKGSNNMPIEAVEYGESYGEVERTPDAIPYEERAIISETQEKKEITMNHKLVINQGKLYLESYPFYDLYKKTTTEINVEVPITDINLSSGYFTQKKENRTDNYESFIRYQKNGKTIIIFPYDLKTKLEFDFVDQRSFAIREHNTTLKETVFLVGKKDQKGQLKYGFFSNVKNQFIGFEYDEIKNIQHYSNDGTFLFKVKQNNKFGVIQSDGKILLPANFSDLKEVHNNYRQDTKVFQIQSDSKYGLIYLTSNEIKAVEPVFDYPIQCVIPKYPEFKNYKINSDRKTIKLMTLIELKDESNNFKGYADFNGNQFFKD